MKSKFFISIIILFFPIINFSQVDSNKIVKFKPVNKGFVFYNGKYIEPPYNIELRGLATYINNICVYKGPTYKPDVKPPWYDEEPKIPDFVDSTTKFWDFFKNKKYFEPKYNLSYWWANYYYFFTHYPYNSAVDKFHNFIKTLPFVKSYENFKIETYDGEDLSLIFWDYNTYIQKELSKKWGPGGTGAETYKDFYNNYIKREKDDVDFLIERLNSDDGLFDFSKYNDAAFDNKEMVIIFEYLQSLNQKNISYREKKKRMSLLLHYEISYRDSAAIDSILNNLQIEKLSNRINTIKNEVLQKYGIHALDNFRGLTKGANGFEEKATNQTAPDNIVPPYNAIPAAFSPNNKQIYAWCGYTYENQFNGFNAYNGELQKVFKELKDYGYQLNDIHIFTDNTLDDDPGTCTYNNLLCMKEIFNIHFFLKILFLS